jgi:hypothetical protein
MRGWTLSAFDPRQTPRRSAERGTAAPDHCMIIQQEEGIACGLLKPSIGLSERALQACLRLPDVDPDQQLITVIGKETLTAWVRQDGS